MLGSEIDCHFQWKLTLKGLAAAGAHKLTRTPELLLEKKKKEGTEVLLWTNRLNGKDD